MKRLLLLLAVLMTANNLFAQLPSPITGANHVCAQSTTTLSDATIGGTWTSSNPAIAAVDPLTGVVTGIAAGAVNISYTVITGFVTKAFTVNATPSVIIDSPTLCLGNPITFLDSVGGGLWSSSAVYIARVGSTSGLVTPISPGNVVISYTLSSGCAKSVSVNVLSTTIYGVAPICLGGLGVSLADATAGGIWTSSNPAIATIDSFTGVVSGIAAGNTTMTYTLSPTCKATALMTVKSAPVITPSPVSACVGQTYALTGTPPGGGWATSNPLVATVNFVGVVTAIAAGTCNITYTAPGGCSQIDPITVHPLPVPITGTNFVYSGFTTGLSDLTPGGTWSSSNTALGTVDPITGIVTGISAGLFLVSYTLPSTGCATTYRVEVNPMPAKTSLQAWWPFCGDTTDHSGPGGTDGGPDLINHTGFTAPAVLTTDRFGNPNNAYQFNGINTMMNYSTFFPNSGVPPDFTYSCWVYVTVAQSSIVWYNGNPNINGFGVVINNGVLGTPGLNAGVYFGATPGVVEATQPLVPGIWHNLVLVKSGGVYHFYIDNGAGLFFVESNTPLFSDVFALGINYRSTLPGFGPITDAYDGKIDDMVIINRQLSAPERLSLYNYNPDAKLFTLGNDTVICSDHIDLAPIPQTVGGAYAWSLWDPAFGFVLKDTTDTVYRVYPTPGPLGNTYQLIISKPYGCSAIDTINVYKSPIPVHLGGPTKNYCLGDTLTLTAFFPNSQFLWSTGDTSHSIQVTGTGTYTLEVDSVFHFINSLGFPDSSVCIGRDTIKVHASVVPFIGLPGNVANCDGTPDTLRPHTDPGYTYLWNDGTTADSLITIATGTYWVKVTDTGCSRTDTSHLLIVFDTVTFYGHDTIVCKGGQVPNTPPFATNNPIVTYQWTPTAGIAISNVYNPVIIPDTSAEYYMTVRYPGCPDIVDSFFVDVEPNPIVSVGGNRQVCYGDSLHIVATVLPSWYTHYNYTWSPATFLDHSDRNNVIFTAGDSVELILTVTTPGFLAGAPGCLSGIDSAGIFVHPGYFDSLRGDTVLCPGDSIQLIPALNIHGVNTNTTFGGFHWSPGMYLDDSTSSQPWVHPITTTNYRIIAYSQYGCKDTLGIKIAVHPNAVINLGDSVIMSPGESYQISPQTNCIFFQWFPPLGLSNPYVADPVASPAVSTSYVVVATTENNCRIIDSIRIHIDPGTLIAIPNAFTPGTGINNIFSIVKKGLVRLDYFRIFDRWGNKVYESNNIDAGWDGNFNGKPQPMGVYVYDIEAVTNTGKIFHRVGNVTLIR
jgi:gliding motility-associated-like protein